MVIFASFIACLALGVFKPSAAFYLIVTRGWELGIGSLGAFIADARRSQPIARRLFYTTLVALFVLPLVLLGTLHPGLQAILARRWSSSSPIIRCNRRASSGRWPG